MKANIKKFLAEPIWFHGVGICFSFFQITGYLLAKNETISWEMAQTFWIVIFSLLDGVIIGYIAYKLCKIYFNNNKNQCNESLKKDVITGEKSIWKVTLISWFIVIGSWVPLFVAYFPGIGSYDFGNQMLSFLQDAVSTHHPVLHTELMGKLWEWTYTEFQSGTVGIAIYCILQMVIQASSFTYALIVLYQLGMSKKAVYIAAVILGMFPLNGYMSISLTKDSIFSSFFVVFFISLLYWVVAKRKNTFYFINIVMFLGSLCGVVWFRNNGRYAILVLCVGICAVTIIDKTIRQKSLFVGLITIVTFISAIGCLKYLERNFWHDPVDENEKYSVPFLQITRTLANHKDELSKEIVDYFEEAFFPAFWENYNPKLADEIKDSFAPEYLEDPEFIEFYLEMFIRYPGEYINAFLALNAGYLYVFDVSCHTPYTEMNEKGNGYIITNENEVFMQSIGIYKHSGLPQLYEWLEEILMENTWMKIPVLGQILAPGIWLYIFLFLLAAILTFGKFRHLIPMSFIGGFYLTVLLGPVVLMRYVYPVMVSLMIYLFRYVEILVQGLRKKIRKK